MEPRIIVPEKIYTTRMVKSEDLNHHGTLFAGRTAEWFVESGFIAAASLLSPQNIVCLKIHGMYFRKPVNPGQILKFSSKIVYAGRSSLVAFIDVMRNDEPQALVNGFVTFIHVDERTKPSSHNLVIHPESQEDIELYNMAKELKNKDS
jgi:acyl-CoA hydrolase